MSWDRTRAVSDVLWIYDVLVCINVKFNYDAKDDDDNIDEGDKKKGNGPIIAHNLIFAPFSFFSIP